MTSDAVRAIADKYFLKTGDQVGPPKRKQPRPEPEIVYPPQKVFWSERKRERFVEWDLQALWVAGPDHPITRGIGHNRLWWAFIMGGTSSFADNITKNAKRWHPHDPASVWFRIWLPTPPHVQQLQFHVVEALDHEEAPNKPWVYLPSELDQRGMPATSEIERGLGLLPLPAGSPPDRQRLHNFRVARGKLEMFFLAVAQRHGMEAYNDALVNAKLEEWDRQEMARQVGDRSRG